MSLVPRSVVHPLLNGEGIARCTTLVLHMEELGRAGKTQEFDTSVALDLPRQQWLGLLTSRLGHLRRKEALLWDFSQWDWAREFQQAAKDISVDVLAPCLYQLRHGGASHDRLVGARSLNEVQQRGNWQSPRSVRRYDKHGRVGLQLQRLGPGQSQALIAQLEESAMNFAMCFVKQFGEHSLVNPGSLSSSSVERARWHDAWR